MLTLKDSKKILLVAPKRLGDAIFTTPTLKALREAKHDGVIDIVYSSKLCEEVYLNNPHINHVFNASELDRKSLDLRYDLILPMLDNGDAKKYLDGLKNVIMIDKILPNTHQKDYFYGFINKLLKVDNPDTLGNYELYPVQSHADYISKIFADNKIGEEQKVLAIHMGVNRTMRYGNQTFKRMFSNKFTSDDAKCWPFKNYFKLINKILKSIPDCTVVITGTPEEKFLSKYIPKSDRIVNLIGKTSVLELAALFNKCSVLLTGDTGPLHVACAMALPTVSLYGPTDPELYGPHPVCERNFVINKCNLKEITIDEVYDALKRFL